MLTRPGQREVSSPVERLQVATFYGLLGVFLGVMGLAAVLWLSQLLGKIQEQNESIQSLTRLVEQSASTQRLVTDTLTEQASGGNPLEFTLRYERAVKARDDAVRQVGIEHTINDALGSRARELETCASSLAADLDSAQSRADRYKKEADEAKSLREQVADLVDIRSRQQEKLDELEPWLKSPEAENRAGDEERA